jgi:alpha-mannosidase
VSGRDRLSQRLDALAVRIDEVGAWRDRHRQQVAFLRILVQGEERPIAVGDPWPVRDRPTRFRATVAVPDAFAGRPLELVADVGGEGLLRVDGVARSGLNPFHDRVRLTDACQADQRWEVEIEAVAHGLFGRRVDHPRVRRIDLVVPDDEVRAFHEDLLATLDGARTHLDRGDRDLADRLATLLRATLTSLPVPRSPTGAYLARVGPTFATDATGDRGGLAAVWEGWTFEEAPLQLSDAQRAAWAEARRHLNVGLSELHADAPGTGTLIATGHAHLDLAWLWPLAETRRKMVRTIASVLDAMDRHPDYRFGQSMAQLYAWLEEDDPELFQRLKARVAEGRFEVAGGMWVEPDGNLPSGEAWVRQLLHGQRWFQSRFGSMPRVGWLPDTFGYAGNLPQLLRLAGLDGFFTTKLEWNDTNRFPYDLYRWEGIDGTRVLAHQVTNPYGGYNGAVTGAAVSETWENFRGKAHHRTSLYPFGHGDGGGGPDEAMLQRLPRLQAFPGLPSLRPGRIDAFFDAADVDGLPVWRGEQYLELHRGTYTTQARIKRLNRRLEHVLVEAEAAATLDGARADDDRGRALHDLWTLLLRNQFHDILPGSSIRTVNQEAEAELSQALTQAEEVRAHALAHLSARIDAGADRLLVVWNLSLDPRPLRAVVPAPEAEVRLFAPDGRAVATQRTSDGLILDDPHATVPSMGYLALRVASAEAGRVAEPPGTLEVAPDRLANERLEVRIADDGTLAALIDRSTGRNLLAGPGDRLVAHPDLPRFFEAWELDPDDPEAAHDLTLEAPPEVVEAGPLRATVRLRRGTDGLRVVQDLRLTRHGDRLEIATRIHVAGRRMLLRSLTTLDVRTDAVAFETAFGAVRRPTHRNTSWDAARFEMPGHRWAEATDGRGGVALLNDGRYGHAADGSTLGLTLVRAPIHPDPYADEGEHQVTYALRPVAGDGRAGTIAAAHDLNAPLLGLWSEGRGHDPLERSFLAVEGPGVRLAALKPAAEGDGAVLRVYEAAGRPTGFDVARLPPGWSVETAVDLLERPGDEGAAGDARTLRAYEVASLRLARRDRG